MNVPGGDLLSAADERERLLQMLLSELDGMVYRCRFDPFWTMEFVSEGCHALTGYRPAELVLNSRVCYEEITWPGDRDRVRAAISTAVAARTPFNIEYRICRADAKVRRVWERGRGIFGAGGEVEAIHGFIQDITDRYRRAEALAAAERRYRSIFENATEGIFQTTEDGYYLEVNPALARIYGYDSTEELMVVLRDIDRQLYVDPGRRDEFTRLMREEGSVTNFEARIYRRDGSVIWISENAHAVRDADGELLYYEGTVEDITERKSYEQLIAHQATHDGLTDLPNRFLLKDRLRKAIEGAAREGLQVAVLFIDLDHFKKVNDSLGHAAGDQLIRTIAGRLRGCMRKSDTVAGRLRGCMRKSDTVARVGGDEFVLMLPAVHSAEIVPYAVNRALEVVRKPCVIHEREFPVSCSIGVSVFPDDGTSVDDLLKHADIAMYQAKQAGRNAFRFFTPQLNRTVSARLELERQLRCAIAAGELELHYQPKVAAASGAVCGTEALVRWRIDDRLVPPSDFIALAEETGLIEQLGAWVLATACVQAKRWADSASASIPVAVNVSPREFRQPGLVSRIRGVLDDTGLDPGLLVLEITENCLAHDGRGLTRTLEELKALGVMIAIDDFGTGYSNMSSLKTMPVDYLKVDGSFAQGLAREGRDRAIYGAIITMAHHLGLRVVGEGVETAAQYEFLYAMGCDEIQGFFFSRPLAVDDFDRWLAAGLPAAGVA